MTPSPLQSTAVMGLLLISSKCIIDIGAIHRAEMNDQGVLDLTLHGQTRTVRLSSTEAADLWEALQLSAVTPAECLAEIQLAKGIDPNPPANTTLSNGTTIVGNVTQTSNGTILGNLTDSGDLDLTGDGTTETGNLTMPTTGAPILTDQEASTVPSNTPHAAAVAANAPRTIATSGSGPAAHTAPVTHPTTRPLTARERSLQRNK